MKKLLILLFVLAAAFTSCDKYDDSDLKSKVESLESRVSALEKIQEAYKNKLTIDAIQPTDNGYIIVFSDKSTVTITNGKDGKDGKDGDTFITSIEIGDLAITFKLSDGSSFEIPRTVQLAISLKCDDEIMMPANSTRDINYEVTADTDVEIEVITSADLDAKVYPDDPSNKKGHIRLFTKSSEMNEFSKVIVLVSNGVNTLMKKVSFTQQGMEVIDNNNKSADCDGGNVALEFYTDGPYEVIIPEAAQSWISIVPQSRAVEKQSVTLQLASNSGEERWSEIIVNRSDGKSTLVFYIYQQAYTDPSDRPAIEYSKKSDRETLIDIYKALDGTTWGDACWCTDMPLESWTGVEVNSEGRVISLSIHNPKGKIPGTIGNLTELKRLELWYISTDYIPDEINMLTKLEHLIMPSAWQKSGLTNSIPESILSLTNLKTLDLSRHKWISIPQTLVNLKNLETLNLHSNNIQGNIPSFIGELHNLKLLDLSYNQFSGPIPESFQNLTNLESLNLTLNSLSGEIPSWIGDLPNLQILSLDMNEFSGQMPLSITKLSQLKQLTISDNELTGSIPTQIGDLSNLVHLSLEENNLNGSIPESILNLKNLEFLGLYHNKLTGTIPVGLGKLPKIKSVRLSDNQLTGEIPGDLGYVSEQVWLWRNHLTGSIPDSFKDKEWFKNGWGQIVSENDLNLTNLLPLPAPDFTMYENPAGSQLVNINNLYNPTGITVYFQWHTRCQYFDDALKLVKQLYDSYTSKQLKVISMTYSECSSTATTMPWKTYYNSQLFYPTYASPQICIIQNGKLIWSDMIQDRFDIIEFVKSLNL